VDCCLSEPITSECWVSLNWFLLLVVTICNAVKAVILCLWLREMRKEGRILTVADMLTRITRRGMMPKWWIQAPSKIFWITINPPGDPTGTSPILGLSVLTNLPQVAPTVLFFLYTSLFTTMVSYTTYNRRSPTLEELAKPAHHLPLHYTI
jgi:hypothetical protein